jgi:hypothetical protein
MSKSRQWKAQRHTTRKQRKSAKHRALRSTAQAEKFAWIMSLEHPHTTMPDDRRIERRFARPVINRSGKILHPARWFTRRHQDEQEAAA